jgi:hypothetical protein
MFSAFLLGLGLPIFVASASIGIYAMLARERLRLLREIRTSADHHSWTFTLKRAYRDPAEFWIQGETFGGVPWKLRSGEPGNKHSSTLRLELTFPTLNGKSDLAVVPRNQGWESSLPVRSLAEAREFPSGLVDFDAAYKVLAAPRRVPGPPLPAALAERFVKWPPNTVAPNPVVAWRDESGFHIEAYLSKMSNWATIKYLLNLGEEICAQLPAPAI